MSALLHLSDLHFGAHDPAVCDAVQRLARRLAPAMAVITGDLTQRATATQFQQAAAFVQQLPAGARLVLPGNHDLPLYAWWLRWGRAYERYGRAFGAELEPVCQAGSFHVVGVNTTRPWRHERGSLSEAQIERVAVALEGASPAHWHIVASHHPLVARDARDQAHRPHRAAVALQRWHAAGASMLLSGHAHEPGLLQPLPGLWVSRAGTAVSHRLRHGCPNSLVVLRVEESGGALMAPQRWAERWDYDAACGEFACISRQAVNAAARAEGVVPPMHRN